MKCRTLISILVPALLILAAGWHFMGVGRASRFLSGATATLSLGTDDPGILEIRLESGDSFRALLEHVCCNGAGFSAVALQSSDGSVYHSRNNYCGEEGFYGEMSGTGIGSLPDLEKYLLANGYTKIHRRELGEARE